MEGSTASLRQRELDVARENAHAFLSATNALEVYRLALARVTPMVRARFSSVFLRDPTDNTLLKLCCAHNWPQASARYLSQLRLRVGRGPTGRAVAQNRPFEVHDVFADPALHEWWDPARELGFISLIAVPLRGDREAIGALTFYFDTPQTLDDDDRHLLLLIADQAALMSEVAEQTDAIRRELERLRADNQRLRELAGEAPERVEYG
jgi:GAF domain-containing protein